MDMFLHVWCCVNCTVVIYKLGHSAVTNHQHKWENGPFFILYKYIAYRWAIFLFYTSTSPIDDPLVYITRKCLKITFEYFSQHKDQLTYNPLACVNGNIPNCKQHV